MEKHSDYEYEVNNSTLIFKISADRVDTTDYIDLLSRIEILAEKCKKPNIIIKENGLFSFYESKFKNFIFNHTLPKLFSFGVRKIALCSDSEIERKLIEKYKPEICSFKSLNEAEEWVNKEAN